MTGTMPTLKIQRYKPLSTFCSHHFARDITECFDELYHATLRVRDWQDDIKKEKANKDQAQANVDQVQSMKEAAKKDDRYGITEKFQAWTAKQQAQRDVKAAANKKDVKPLQNFGQEPLDKSWPGMSQKQQDKRILKADDDGSTHVGIWPVQIPGYDPQMKTDAQQRAADKQKKP